MPLTDHETTDVWIIEIVVATQNLSMTADCS